MTPQEVILSNQVSKMVLVFTAITFLSTLSGGLLALRFKDKLHLILGFSAGAVIGVSFFELLPQSLEIGSKYYGAGVLTATAALGFFFTWCSIEWPCCIFILRKCK